MKIWPPAIHPHFAGISVDYQEQAYADTSPTVCFKLDGPELDTFRSVVAKDQRVLMVGNDSVFFATIPGQQANKMDLPRSWSHYSLLFHLINASNDLTETTREGLKRSLLGSFKTVTDENLVRTVKG